MDKIKRRFFLYCRNCGELHEDTPTAQEWHSEKYLQGDEPLWCERCQCWKFFDEEAIDEWAEPDGNKGDL